MKETQKRIMEYNFKLPKLKEKVIAVALLLAVSASMLVTVSFAWLSISINPAVQGVNTTIAANGNLEIALATGSAATITAPGESKVGDSNLAILERNLTWGNLVNLADASYGLSQMTLRPAKLNDNGQELATNPLHGPVYDESGRLVMLDTSFGYSTWNSELSAFEITDNLGVRAITSMIEGEATEASVYRADLNAVKSDNSLVLHSKYKALAENEDYMNALSVVLVGYMAEVIRNGTGSLADYVYESEYERKQLEDFRKLYEAFKEVLETEAELYAKFLNLQAKVEGKTDTITAEEILALPYNTGTKSAAEALTNMGYTAAENGFINNVDTFLSDYNIIKEDIVNVQGIIDAMPNSGKVSWTQAYYTDSDGNTVSLADVVNRFSNLGECVVMLPPESEYTSFKVKSIGGTYAMEMMKGTSDVIITKEAGGLLYNFEQRTGARLYVAERSMSIKVSSAAIIILGTNNITVTVNVKTAATDNYFNTETMNLDARIASLYGTPRLVPNEAYGLAIDFWVRTNASGGYLTLQGNVLTEKEEIEVTGIDKNGNTVNIYSLSREITQEVTGENSETTTQTYTQDYELYWLEEEVDGQTQTVWYNALTHVEFALEEGETPKQKIEIVETVIGYEGDNRVWEGDEHAILSVNSTTQGSGSCYVYYASTPEDQARSLELLKYMKVAFIDAEGNLLAKAEMDTERHYAANGKVTVPMVLENNSDSINLGTDDDGNPIIAITALEKNTPMLVTAIVYLDGDGLTNQHVLASSDIDGQLNIQFGNNQLLEPIDNEELYYSEMKVSASVTDTEFSYDDNTEMKTTVEVIVDGVEPNTVEAFFIRAINAQTGAKEKTFTLSDDDGDGVWTADYEFLYPGTYILRSVTIDGIERELTVEDGKDFPTVTVKGFEINNVNYNINPTVLSVDNSYTGDVSLQFVTDDPDRMPKTVTGKFIREDGTTVNVNFAYNPTTQLWSGKATFVSSGEYTMQYVVLDGEYTELDEGNRFTTDVKLGVKVDVSTNTKTSFVKDDVKDDYPKTLDMMVVILDNANNRITNVTDASLTYSLRGSPATMYTPLTWNAEKQCFVGSFITQTGIWSFSHVDIKYGDAVNTLSKANGDAPVFTILAPDPPENVSGKEEGTPYQYVSGIKTDNDLYEMVTENGATKVTVKGASASVVLKYATAAQVYAKLVPASTNVNKTPVYVLGASSTDSMAEQTTIFTFAIPEGEWILESVSAFDVFDADQMHHPWKADEWNVDGKIPAMISEQVFEEGMKIDVADTTVAALYNVEIEFGYANTKNTENYYIDENNKKVIFGMGEDGKEIVSEFMASHTISKNDITITFTDANGLIQSGKFGISDVGLTINYVSNTPGTVSTYGGYTTTGTFNAVAARCNTFNVNGNVATLGADAMLQYAAQYKMGTLTYSVIAGEVKTSNTNDKAYELKNAHLYEVWSKAPTVTIDAISVNPATARYYTTTRPSSTDGMLTGSYNKKIDDYSAVVYMYFAEQGGLLDQECVAIKYPTVTLKLAGVPSDHGGATMVFPSGNNTSSTFKFASADTKATSTIGAGSNGTYGTFSVNSWPVLYPAGAQTVQTITVTYGGVDYTVALSDAVTINNPLCPAYVDFSSTASGQTLPTTPSRIYGTPQADGTFVITLPGSQTWTEAMSETNNGDFVVQSGYPSTRNVYTERSETSGCSTTTYYAPYIETTTVSKATSSTTTWTRTWKITGWKVGNTTYDVGETITLTSQQTFTPVLSYTDSAKTTVASTTTRTVISYTANGSETTTKPSGSKVDSVTGSTTDVVN